MQTGSERQSLSQWFQTRGGDPGQHRLHSPDNRPGKRHRRSRQRREDQQSSLAWPHPSQACLLPTTKRRGKRHVARIPLRQGDSASFLGARTQGGWDGPTGNHHLRPKVAAEGLYEKLKVAQVRATPQVSLALRWPAAPARFPPHPHLGLYSVFHEPLSRLVSHLPA